MSLTWLKELALYCDIHIEPRCIRHVKRVVDQHVKPYARTREEGDRTMHCVGGCGAFIPQGQVGYFIGGSIHLPVCRTCAEKERGGPPPPQPPVTTLYPGIYVGHFPDHQLLVLLNYWPRQMR